MTEELEVHRQSVSRSIQYSDYSSGDDAYTPVTPSSNAHHVPAYQVSMASTEAGDDDDDDESSSSFDMTAASQIERNKQNTKKRVSNAIQLRMSSFQPNPSAHASNGAVSPTRNHGQSSASTSSQKEKKQKLAARWQTLMRANSTHNGDALHESQQPIQQRKKPQSLDDGNGSFAIQNSSNSHGHKSPSQTSSKSTPTASPHDQKQPAASAMDADPYQGLSPIEIWKKKKMEREQNKNKQKTKTANANANVKADVGAMVEMEVEMEVDEKQQSVPPGPADHHEVDTLLAGGEEQRQQRYRDDFESELKKLQVVQTETSTQTQAELPPQSSEEAVPHRDHGFELVDEEFEAVDEEKVQAARSGAVELDDGEHVDMDPDEESVTPKPVPVDTDALMEHVYNHFCVDEQCIVSGRYVLLYMREQLQLRLVDVATCAHTDDMNEHALLALRGVMTELFGDDVAGAYGYYVRLRTDERT